MGVKVVNCWNKNFSKAGGRGYKISLLHGRRDPFSFRRRKEENYSYGCGEWGVGRRDLAEAHLETCIA